MHPAELIGIHTTFPGVFPAEIEKAIQTHGELPPDLSADERRAVETLTDRLRVRGPGRDGVAPADAVTDWLTHPSPWRPG